MELDDFLDDLEADVDGDMQIQMGEVDSSQPMDVIEKELAGKKRKRYSFNVDGCKQFMHCTNKIRSPGLPDCQVDNVVCTFSINKRPNLKKMALYMRNKLQCKFNPSKFAAMGIIFDAPGLPKITALLFSTSNVVLTGPKSEEFARCSAYVLNYFLNIHLGIHSDVVNFQIRNIVSHFNLGYEIDLEGLHQEIGSRATFVPDKIYCCRIRALDNWEHVCLVFMSGAVVITGAKNRKDIRVLYEEIAAVCAKHRNVGQYNKDDHKHRYSNNDPKKLMDLNRKLNNMNKESMGSIQSESRAEIKQIIKEIDKICPPVYSNPMLEILKSKLLV